MERMAMTKHGIETREEQLACVELVFISASVAAANPTEDRGVR